MAVTVSCANDIELARKLHKFLVTRLDNTATITVNEDEISIDDKKLGRNNEKIRERLDDFLASSPELAGHSILEFAGVFTIGILQNIEKVVSMCEMCGYVARHDSELRLHKTMHCIYQNIP